MHILVRSWCAKSWHPCVLDEFQAGKTRRQERSVPKKQERRPKRCAEYGSWRGAQWNLYTLRGLSRSAT